MYMMYMEWNFIQAPNGVFFLSSNLFSIRIDVIKLFGELNDKQDRRYSDPKARNG